MRVKKKTSKLI